MFCVFYLQCENFRSLSTPAGAGNFARASLVWPFAGEWWWSYKPVSEPLHRASWLFSCLYVRISVAHFACLQYTRFLHFPFCGRMRTWEFSRPYRLPIILPFCLYAVSGRFRCTHGLPFLPFLISSLNSATHFSPHVPNHQFSTCMFSTSQPNEYLLYFNIPNVYTLDTLRACHHTYMKGQKNCVCALFWPAQIPPNPCEIMWCCCCWLRKRVKCKFLEPEPQSQVHWSESISILANAWYYTLRL